MKVETSTQNRKASAFFTSLVKRWAKKVSSQACISSTCWHLLIVHAWPGVPEAGSCDKERRLKQKHAVAGEEEEEETKREHLVLCGKFVNRRIKGKAALCSVCAQYLRLLLPSFSTFFTRITTTWVYYVFTMCTTNLALNFPLLIRGMHPSSSSSNWDCYQSESDRKGTPN